MNKKTLLRWAFGILFVGLGIQVVSSRGPIVSVPLFLIALLLLPPTSDVVEKSIGKNISGKLRAIIIFVLFVIFSFMSVSVKLEKDKIASQKTATEKAELMEKQKEKEKSERLAIVDDFTKNKSAIMNEIKTEYEQGFFQKALEKAEKYLVANDPDLREIYENAKMRQEEKEENDFFATVESGQKNINVQKLLASSKGMEILKKYNIVIEKLIEPKVNPLWVRQHVMEYIQNDFDRDFLSSIDLSIFRPDDTSNYTFAQFKRDYTYTDPRSGKNKKGKRVFRSFKVINDGTVQEGPNGERVVYRELNSLESKKATDYSLELRDEMYRAPGSFNKQEWERQSDIDYASRLERQKQEYIDMVQGFENNNQ